MTRNQTICLVLFGLLIGYGYTNQTRLITVYKQLTAPSYAAKSQQAYKLFDTLYTKNKSLFKKTYEGNVTDLVSDTPINAQMKLMYVDTRFNTTEQVMTYLKHVEGEFAFDNHKTMYGYDWTGIEKDIESNMYNQKKMYSLAYVSSTDEVESCELYISSEGYIMLLKVPYTK